MSGSFSQIMGYGCLPLYSVIPSCLPKWWTLIHTLSSPLLLFTVEGWVTSLHFTPWPVIGFYNHSLGREPRQCPPMGPGYTSPSLELGLSPVSCFGQWEAHRCDSSRDFQCALVIQLLLFLLPWPLLWAQEEDGSHMEQSSPRWAQPTSAN